MGPRRDPELIGSLISKGKGHDASGQHDCLPYNESINFLGWRAEALPSPLPSQRSVSKVDRGKKEMVLVKKRI